MIDQLVEGDGLTVLRYPKMGAIKWDWKGMGYTATVDYSLGGNSNIVLNECKVDHFKILAQNGGSVTITFRIIAHPESEDVGKLCEFIQRDIGLDLLPPAPQTVHELFGDDAKMAA